MWRFLKLAFLTLFLSLFFSSCFKIEEIISFKTRDSGTVQYIIDLSSMMNMVKLLGAASEDSSNTEPEASTMLASSFGEVKAELEKISGVSNVIQLEDRESSRYGIKADFADIKALNTVLSLLYDVSDNKEEHTYHEFVKRKKNTYEYLEPIDIRENIEKSLMLSDAGQGGLGGIDPMMFFNDLSISSKMVFFNRKIRKSKNTGSVISGDTVAVTSYPFSTEIVSLKNTITVK